MPRTKRAFDEMENRQSITLGPAEFSQRKLRNRVLDLDVDSSISTGQDTPVHETDSITLPQPDDLSSAVAPYVRQAVKGELRQMQSQNFGIDLATTKIQDLPIFKALIEQVSQRVTKETKGTRDKKIAGVSEELTMEIENVRVMIKPLQKRIMALSEHLDAALERIDTLEDKLKLGHDSKG